MLIWIAVLFSLVMIGLIVMSVSSKEDEKDKDILSMRKRQSQTSLRELALKKKLESLLEDRVEVSKRYKLETKMMQAGIKATYGEYRILTIMFAIVLPLISLFLMKSIYQLPVLAFVGFMIPGQVVDFFRNRRMIVVEKQVGSFIKLTVERYSSHGDFAKALKDTTDDFEGREPIYSELRTLRSEIELGRPLNEAMNDLYRRVGNPYLKLLGEFYEIASSLGTKAARTELMREVHNQYREAEKLRSTLRKEIAGPKREAFIMLGAIPLMLAYQFSTSPDYADFMMNTTTGQIGLSAILAVLLGAFWFVNKKIGAPIE